MSLHPLDAAGTVADVNGIFDRYARQSARTRKERPCLRNVAYGESAAETLDFFPAGRGAPLAVFFHGGYWRRLDKDHFSFIAQGLVPLGVSFASVNYALAPAARLPEIVEQAQRAVTWIRGQHHRFNFDPERLVVFGHSAGGHLAAMAGVAVPVHAVASISGLHDLHHVRASFVNEWLNLSETEARELSPALHKPAAPFPVYVTAGEKESEDGFKAQGRALVEAWKPYGCDAAYEDSRGDDHFSVMFRLMNPGNALTRKIAQLAH